MSRPSLWTIAFRSLRHFVRPHATVALGVAAATAVLVGALVVGDSVRGSLRNLVVGRLANIDCLLQARVFFNPDILDGLNSGGERAKIAQCIILSSSTVEKRHNADVSRASKVQILGVGTEFWDTVSVQGPVPEIEPDCVALNDSLARELGVVVGDEVAFRVRPAGGVPNDNPLGSRDDTSISVPRQKVIAILPDAGIGGLSFRATQSVPRNVFASIETLQDVLDCGEKVNAAILVGGDSVGGDSASPDRILGQRLCDALNPRIRPSLEDFGLQFTRHLRIFPDVNLGEELDGASSVGREIPGASAQPLTGDEEPQLVYDYFQLSSNELILDDATSSAVMEKLADDKPARLLSYLANSIAKVESLSAGNAVAGDASNIQSEIRVRSREVPYSIMLGVDRSSELDLDRFREIPTEDLQTPYCWVNAWLAEQIDLSAGDWFRATFYEPETVDGREVEKSARFLVVGVVPLTEPERGFQRTRPAAFRISPTIFNDPGLTPNVPGVTDQDSISQWDTPFPLENEISPADDEYWANHRLTPKVFIPYRYATSKGMFASRFGKTTAIRIPASHGDAQDDEAKLRATIEESLLRTRAQKGFAFQPIREQQLQAASGTTPFDGLFLALSFFVIVAALLLVFLLFRLSIQQRVSELGILLAQGFAPSTVRSLLLRELTVVAMVGAILGILLGLGYARAMIAGLESWWLGAITTRFLDFFARWQSLAIGAISGFFASLIAITIGLSQLCKLDPLTAISGKTSEPMGVSPKPNRLRLALAGIAGLCAVGLIVAGLGQSGMARAGTFFGSGMLLLVAALLVIRQRFEAKNSMFDDPAKGSLFQLALKSVCRNSLRSSLALGLLSVATFLVVSMGVFQIRPTEKGYGGFNLLAESSQPIYRDIGSDRVRADVLGDDAKSLLTTTIVSMRARIGDDASCNNLFQVTQPTILGVTERLQTLHAEAPDSVEFEWSATDNALNPWASLATPAVGDEANPIPVILDQNTAAWSLKQGAKVGASIELRLDDRPVYFRTVGLLANSVLQGKLLIGQENFKHRFPQISGYSFFLIRSGPEPQLVRQALEKGWSGEGLDVTDSAETLAQYLGVQNTYISAFQSLGALGLLLGTFGLIAVQVRSVLERQREFALMRAIGFAPDRIAKLLTVETAILLGGGLLTGLLCAAVALVPYIVEVGPQLSLLNPIIMLLVVLLAGFSAAIAAVRTATKQPILDGLRSQ